MQSGGANTASNSLYVGVNAGSSGSHTQSGGTNNVSYLYLTDNPGSRGTYDLNGGRLTAGEVVVLSGTGIFSFNGGMLQASGSSSRFVIATAANVQAGGAIVDVQGFNVAIDQGLLHDPAAGHTHVAG